MRLIDADAAIMAVSDQEIGMLTHWDMGRNSGLNFAIEKIKALPTVQPEPAIPLSWIENEIKWLKSLDNTFSEITALQISAMVKKWRDEQNETD